MLNDNVRLLKAITNNASVALFILNEVQHCVFMNPAAERLTGFSLAEVRGRPLHDVIHHTHPDGRHYPLEECPIDRAFPSRNQATGEEVFVHKDGRFYEVAFTASPIRDDADQPIGTIIEVQDVTERNRQQRAARAEAELLELLNQTSKLIAAELDLERLLQGVTDAATKLTGAQFGAFFYNGMNEQGEAYLLYTLSGAPREAFARFGHPRPTPMFGPTFRGAPVIHIADVTQDPRYGQWGPHHGMPHGHLPVRSYLAVSVTSRRGDVIGGLFFGHSQPNVFTERSERLATGIAAQASAAIDNARLYAEAQRATRQRDALLDSERSARLEAESSNRLKDQFLATLSHELRTPLSAILGWLHILRRKGASEPSVLSKGIEIIERSARTQHQLVEDLLDVSRITSGKLRLELAQMDAATTVAAAVELIAPSAASAGVTLTLAPGNGTVPVLADAARLQQVVGNLLSNAVKFTPPGGVVRVCCCRAGDHAEIRVQDTGAGIRPEFLPHLFEPFRQADQSTARNFGGLGIGLTLVDQLTRLHGARVNAESAGEGQGSTFTVTFPLASEIPASDKTPHQSAPPQKVSGRILLVEDDEAGREFVARLLRDAGAIVATASNPSEARALLTSEKFQLLISDIGMPGEDGYQFVRWLRQQHAPMNGLPAIALTAFARIEDASAARDAGFHEHVTKPVDVATLMHKVSNLLQRV